MAGKADSVKTIFYALGANFATRSFRDCQKLQEFPIPSAFETFSNV